MRIVGVLLCGGSATRFGADKLLAGDPPLAARSARNLKAKVERVIAVIPTGKSALREVLEAEGCEVLESDRTSMGLGASLAAGVEAAASVDGWIVALGDMPAITPQTISAVRRALEEGARIAAPIDGAGRRGHPVGFAASLREELVALRTDVGAREIIQRHAGEVRLVRCDDPGILYDVDTPEDLQRGTTRPVRGST